jgi:hypothetical protein
MIKDWTGNKKTTYVTLGASNHTDKERQVDDYYATDPKTIAPLFEVEKFDNMIWECACGEGHLSKAMEEFGKDVFSTDKFDRGYGQRCDFLEENMEWFGDIITNPPYKYAQEFIEKALLILKDGKKLAMFLKIQFLEGQGRRKLFDLQPPKRVYIFSKRQSCAMNGEFDKYPTSAVAYAWYVWEKGYKGDTTIKWI